MATTIGSGTQTLTNRRGALFLMDVEGIGVDMEEFRYDNHHWFREQTLTNKRRAFLHLVVEGISVDMEEFRYSDHHWFMDTNLDQ